MNKREGWWRIRGAIEGGVKGERKEYGEEKREEHQDTYIKVEKLIEVDTRD